MRRRSHEITVLLLIALVTVGTLACRSDRGGAGASADEKAVPSGSSAALEATQFGTASNRAIVLITDDDKTEAWVPLAQELGRTGYRVLLIPRPSGDGAASVRAAADRLLKDGTEQVVFVGSRRGIDAALQAAADGASGVVLLNPVGREAGVPPTGMPPVALLVMASLVDGPSSASAQELYHSAREPRTLALYPSRDEAPAAFAGASNELKSALLDFIRSAFEPLSA